MQKQITQGIDSEDLQTFVMVAEKMTKNLTSGN